MELLILLVFIFLAAKFFGSTFGGACIIAGILTWLLSLLGVDGQPLKIVFGILLFIFYSSMLYAEKKEGTKNA